MDPFTIIVTVGMAVLIIAILLLGLYHPKSGAEILDWKPTRSPELEYQNEIDDFDQMIAAQNELRRRHGKPERTQEEVEEEVRRHKGEMDEYARRYWEDQRRRRAEAEAGGGPEGQDPGREPTKHDI